MESLVKGEASSVPYDGETYLNELRAFFRGEGIEVTDEKLLECAGGLDVLLKSFLSYSKK